MATVSKWTPFGVALNITATAGAVTRTSATSFSVLINASWETYYSGAKTNYGMTATSGGVTSTLTAFSGEPSSGGSSNFLGTYKLESSAANDILNGNATTQNILVTFRNFNDLGDSATNKVMLTVDVPALPSYIITYNANGGTGAPGSQIKWRDINLTLSTLKPTRTGYKFKGWSTSSSATFATWSSGGSYTNNSAATLYAVWEANTYIVKYNANGGTGAPADQTKTYGKTLTLSSTKPTRQQYSFKGWGTSASATTVSYAAGASYTNNAAITLYAIWELSYVEPRIFNISVARCDNTATLNDEGMNALVTFDWETDTVPPTIRISCYRQSDSSLVASDTFPRTNTGGTFSETIGNNGLSPETSYKIEILVDDSIGSSYATRILSSIKFPIDFLSGGKGVAFGKTAELEDTVEFKFDAKFDKPVYGKVLGMDRLPAIPEDANLDDYLEPGCYAAYSNEIAETCLSLPYGVAGRLEVWSATGEGVRSEQWSYLRQRYIPYDRKYPVSERDITRGEDNVWHYSDWWWSSLTPAAMQKVYLKAAATIALSSNTTLGVLNTYTKIPLNQLVASTNDRLTMTDNSIRIGSGISHVKVSGLALLKCGSTAGNRHVRIQKVSASGTVTNISWACVYGVANSNTPYSLTPVIVPVNEGDSFRMVFYTSDTADMNASGSATNGWQTYLTVEEL